MRDYCAKYVAYIYNGLPRKKDGKSPYERRYKRKPSVHYFRRFGCLAFPKVHVDHGVLADRNEVGIFLGYTSHRNSCYLIGVWRSDNR